MIEMDLGTPFLARQEFTVPEIDKYTLERRSGKEGYG